MPTKKIKQSTITVGNRLDPRCLALEDVFSTNLKKQADES
jgi:hypothetical protein